VAGPALISAVVLTRDRGELLRRCVRSLLEADYPRREIVVLDNGSPASRAENRAWLAGLDAPVRLHHVEAAPCGFARLRRMAYARAEGEIVMSIDDDCEAHPGALARIAQRFAAEADLGLLGGNIRNEGFGPDERLKGRGRLGRNARYEAVEDPSQAEVFGSANQSVRRAAYERAGGFDPFFGAGLEEADLALSLRRLGYRVGYDPEVRITHRHSPQRFRSRWRNLHTMRLYLCLKHFPPRGAAGWARFLRDELAEVGEDGRRLLAALPRRRGLVREVAWLGLESFKIVAARARIPELWVRARRARRALECRAAEVG